VSRRRRLSPGRRRLTGPVLALVLLVLVTAGGTLGYVVLEGWSWWDSFYMTAITVTTVGYREVHDLDLVGQVFTVLLLAGGVGTAFYAFTLVATIVVEGGLAKRLLRHRIGRMIDELTGHFILCGFGRIGSVIADEFRQQDIPFVIIERDAERVQNALDRGMLVVEADASREETLKRLHIERARGMVAAVGTDAENVYTILTARVLAPGLFIVGRAETEDAERKIRRAGADRVVSPYSIGAQQMAQTALRPAVVDFVKLATQAGNLDLAMEQIRVAGGSSLANHTLVEANLRQRFGVIVVGIQRAGGRMEFNPSPDAVMRDADQLVVLGRPASLRDLEHAAGQETASRERTNP
jgi:voltage-gated potassium channel